MRTRDSSQRPRHGPSTMTVQQNTSKLLRSDMYTFLKGLLKYRMLVDPKNLTTNHIVYNFWVETLLTINLTINK